MAISNKLRPEQIEVTTGPENNDTVPTTGYVGFKMQLIAGAQPGTLDQQNSSFNVSSAGNDVWQSFTPSVDGYLVAVSFNGASGPYTGVRLRIYDGEGTSGTLLSTTTGLTLNTGLTKLVIATPPPQMSGSKLTARLDATTLGLLYANNDPYAGGRCNINATSDFVFETYESSEKEIVKADATYEFAATETDYDNSVSGLTATEVQSAIDEIVAGSGGDWERKTSPSNYLIPIVNTDPVGAIAERISKIWMSDFDSTDGSCDTLKSTEIQTTTGTTVTFNNPNTVSPLWNFKNSAGARFTIANVDTTSLELESKAEAIYFKVPTGKGFEWQVNSVPIMSLDATNGWSLATGTSVKEISTIVSSSSTDDQVSTSKAIYDAINTKEVFLSGRDYSGNLGEFRAYSNPTSGNANFTFCIPMDFGTLVSFKAIGIISAGAAGINKDIDLNSDYGATGEAYNNHTESDTGTLYDYTGKTNQLTEFVDLSIVLSSLSAGDYVGIEIDNNVIGGTIYCLGFKLVYNQA